MGFRFFVFYSLLGSFEFVVLGLGILVSIIFVGSCYFDDVVFGGFLFVNGFVF